MPTATRQFTALAAALSVTLAAGCSGDDSSDTIPDGDYRAEVTVDELVAAEVSETVAEDNGGVQVLTIDGDTFEFKVLGSGVCHGTLAYEADQVTFVHGSPPNCVPDESVELFSARWEVTGDELTLDVFDVCSEPECPARFDPLMELLYGSQPFVRQG